MPEKPSVRETSHKPILDIRSYTIWSIIMGVELSERGLCEVCHSNSPPGSDPSIIAIWNQENIEAVKLILSRLYQEIIVGLLDGIAFKSSKELWSKITLKYALQTMTIRGRTWGFWEFLRFNGNIEEYIKECSEYP
ncbi:hypothetical protein O181_082746 [Austropuccinia psidii MF-1]|uniref:Retrotransposon Copia-like N-terminal domain-containing protein n=1 Tax=Austropuccinia psidii MF-1 TaxID=1389203 RepID=A0A9Q3FMP8_9BASI|nr:hypothetical protein [Austropuccinia psidii MF-1]